MGNLFRTNKKGSGGGLQIDSLTITSMPTKTYYVQGDTLDLTGLAVSATAGSLSGDVTSLITTSPADGATMSTLGTNTVTVTYLNASVTFNVTVAVLPEWDSRGLNYNSWATIQAYTRAGELGTVAAEGDTKDVTIGSYTYKMQLVGINDGTGTAGQYYPADTADFIAVELYEEKHNINSTGTNEGGWNNADVRSWLNSTVYNLLPSDLKTIIIEKTHMRTEGNQSSSMISASDNLWLPTRWELMGSDAQGETEAYNKHYSIFNDNASRIKKVGTLNSSWWTSSPQIYSNSAFINVESTGSVIGGNANSVYGIAICFRIG